MFTYVCDGGQRCSSVLQQTYTPLPSLNSSLTATTSNSDYDDGKAQAVQVHVRAAYNHQPAFDATQVCTVQRSDGRIGVLISTPESSGFIPSEDLIAFKLAMYIPRFSLAIRNFDDKIHFDDVSIQNVFGGVDIHSLWCNVGKFKNISTPISCRCDDTDFPSLDEEKGHLSAVAQFDDDGATILAKSGEGSVKAHIAFHAQPGCGNFSALFSFNAASSKDNTGAFVMDLSINSSLNVTAKSACGNVQTNVRPTFEESCNVHSSCSARNVSEVVANDPSVANGQRITVDESIFLDEGRRYEGNIGLSAAKADVVLFDGGSRTLNATHSTADEISRSTDFQPHVRNGYFQERCPAYTESFFSYSDTPTLLGVENDSKEEQAPDIPSPLPFALLQLPAATEYVHDNCKVSFTWLKVIFSMITGILFRKKRVADEEVIAVGASNGIKRLAEQ